MDTTRMQRVLNRTRWKPKSAWVGGVNRWRRAANALRYILVALFLFLIYFLPIIVSIFLSGNIGWMSPSSNVHDESMEEEASASSVYKKKRASEPGRVKIQRVSVVSATRVGIFVLFWLVINLSVPDLRETRFLGSFIWKWSVLAAVVLLLIPAMLVASFILANHQYSTILVSICGDDEPIPEFYWIKGLEESVRWVLYFALVLLVWVLYFLIDEPELTHVGRKRKLAYLRIYRYIILAMVSSLVGSLIGFLNNLVVLRRKSKFIYTDSNKVRILVAAFRLYLLLLLKHDEDRYEIRSILMPYYSSKSLDQLLEDTKPCLSNQDRTCTVDNLMKSMSTGVSLHEIDEAATWMTQRFDLSEETPSDSDSKFLEDILYKYKGTQHIDSDVLTKHTPGLGPREAKILLGLLRLDIYKGISTSEMDLTAFENWMIEARKSCFVYLNELHGHMSLERILLRVLTISQVVAVVILWLFITQLATTRLVLTLGSLFVGISVIFGDCCKTFLQGFILAFVTHPFNVGDLVMIEKTMLEVKKIMIFTTVFHTVDRDQIVVYPNSVIATTKIIKLKGKPTPEKPGTISPVGSRPGSENNEAQPARVPVEAELSDASLMK